MVEYIEKQTAIDAINHELLCGSTADACGLETAYDLIHDLKPADVRPVVRGRWVKARGSFFTPGGDPVWECSECGKGRHVYGIEHGTYGADVSDGQWVACPNCRAFMEDKS